MGALGILPQECRIKRKRTLELGLCSGVHELGFEKEIRAFWVPNHVVRRNVPWGQFRGFQNPVSIKVQNDHSSRDPLPSKARSNDLQGALGFTGKA